MNDQKIKLLLVLGTGRKGRMSERVANFLLEEISKDQRFDVRFVDVRDFPLSFSVSSDEDNKHANDWRQHVLWSQVIIFVAPEYNRGFPGELKILLDSAFEEYIGKISGICSVSSGVFGGVRMAEKLRSLLVYLGMRPIRKELSFPLVEEDFNNKLPKNINIHLDGLKKMLGEIFLMIEK